MSIAPDSKPSSKWYEKHCFDLHRQRVEGMKSSLKSSLRSTGELLSSHRSGGSPSSRMLEVQRENEALLRKLAFISSIQPKETWQPSLPASLNSTLRKREQTRIASENQLISKRLMNGKACMNTKQLEEDYKRACEYKRLFKSAYVEKPSRSVHLSEAQ